MAPFIILPIVKEDSQKEQPQKKWNKRYIWKCHVFIHSQRHQRIWNGLYKIFNYFKRMISR